MQYKFTSKAKKLVQEVDRIIASESNPKILVFSSFQNTLAYVKSVLEEEKGRQGGPKYEFRTIDSVSDNLTIHTFDSRLTQPPPSLSLLLPCLLTLSSSTLDDLLPL